MVVYLFWGGQDCADMQKLEVDEYRELTPRSHVIDSHARKLSEYELKPHDVDRRFLACEH